MTLIETTPTSFSLLYVLYQQCPAGRESRNPQIGQTYLILPMPSADVL